MMSKYTKIFLLSLGCMILWPLRPAQAQTASLPTVSGTASEPPSTSLGGVVFPSLLSHVSAVDTFRQDGSHVVKFMDGILAEVPYAGDYLLIQDAGFISDGSGNILTSPKSYGGHIHLMGYLADKYLNVNPTYAAILNDLEFNPGYHYDTDVHHGGLDFSVGYTHKFGK